MNYSLYFCGKLLKKKKIKGVEDTLSQNWWGEIDPEFYQNSWAFICYLRTSDYQEGSANFEEKLLASKLDSAARQLEAAKIDFANDMKAFDKAYKKQLKTWAELSPDKMR